MSSRHNFRVFVALVAALSLPTLLHAAEPGIAWRDNLDAAKIEAAKSGRLLLLHFWTPSCGPCKLLDQNVLSQPQVGAAVERAYVPVKINADVSPALANMFKIDRVPTEVVVTPQGNVVATLSTPDTPDAYVAQLENLARHFKQTTPASVNAQPTAVNAAYASLPQSSASANPPAPQSISTQAVAAPQSNPYVVAAPSAAPAQAYASPQSQMQAPATTVAASATAAAPGAAAIGGAASMPGNAMPRSYRDAMSAGPAAGTPGAVAMAGTAAAAAVPTASPPATNPAYAAIAPPAGPSTNGIAAAAQPAATPPATTAPATTATVQVAQVQPTQPPLPANCPPVGFDGYCPVTLRMLNTWAVGNTQYGVIHRGRTYLFVGEEQRRQFLADPDSYSPVFAGYDPVLLLDKQQTVPGSRKYGFKYGNAFYLFSCVETRDKFQANKEAYAATVRQAMAKVDAAGATVRR